MHRLAFAFIIILAISGTALSSDILFQNIALTASSANPIPTGVTYTPGLAGGGGIGGAQTFTMLYDGMFDLNVVDCCIVGDVFEVLIDGASQGLTASEPIGGTINSTGDFSLFLTAGSHNFDIWDITISYIGSASPFGGGTVTSDYTPAGLSVTGTASSAVPEPGTLGLLGVGLLGSFLGLRRKK